MNAKDQSWNCRRVGILLVDVASAQVVMANRHASKLLGLDAAQLASLKIFDLKTRISRDQQWVQLINELKTEGDAAFDDVVHAAGDQALPVTIRLSLLSNGNLEYIVFCIVSHHDS